MYIPYGRQTIQEDDILEVVKVLRSDYLTTGPMVDEFEQKVAEYVGAKYAVAVTNGTAALHIACLAAGIGPGDEVITTPLTFAASANCVFYSGGTPVFADIDPITYNIDPEDIKRKITPKTKAIIPVHYTGQPCDMEAIHQIAREHHLLVIEDAAHALGASIRYAGKEEKIGGLSDMTCFSFHPVKPVTTGEGGMVVTNDEKLYKLLRLYRSHGITREEDSLIDSQGAWYYEQQVLGFNYRITDIGCALGVSQLKKLDGFIKRRREIAARYQEAFSDLEMSANDHRDVIRETVTALQLPVQASFAHSGWHLYMIQIHGKDRKEVFDKLRGFGIGVNVHYLPVYKHPYYQERGYRDVCCEHAEAFYQRAISLPIFPGLTKEQQDYVIEKVRECVLQ